MCLLRMDIYTTNNRELFNSIKKRDLYHYIVLMNHKSSIMRLSVFSIYVLLILLSKNGLSQEHTDLVPLDLNSKISALIDFGIKNKAFPGAQVLIFKHDSIRLHKAYGYHTYDSITPVSKEDLYDLASVTKVIGSTLALMKLYELYDFDLDQPASKLIPILKRSNKKKHSFREILSHSAGWLPYIAHQNLVFKKQGEFKKNTLSYTQSDTFPYQVSDSLFVHKRYQKKIYRRIKKTKVTRFGEMVYSGMFYFFIPELVKSMSGLTLPDFLDTHFYQPMELERLSFLPIQKFPKTKIVPTEHDSLFRKKLIQGWVHDEAASLMGGISGNAGLFANAASVAPLLEMLLQKGSYQGKKYISPETITLFTQRAYPKSTNPRGLGFDKPSLDRTDENRYPSTLVSPETFGHTGYTGTMVWVDPTNDCYVILLSNRVYPSRTQRALYDLNIRPQLLDHVIQD